MCKCSSCLLKGTQPQVSQPSQGSPSPAQFPEPATDRPTVAGKQVTGPGSHQGLPVGVSWQRRTFCSSRLIAHLCSPKTAAGDSSTLPYTSFFPPFSLQIHHLLCFREPTEWVSVIISSWEQLGWYRLSAKAAPAPLSLALAVLVAPTRPSSSSLHCLNILCCCCPGCHHE